MRSIVASVPVLCGPLVGNAGAPAEIWLVSARVASPVVALTETLRARLAVHPRLAGGLRSVTAAAAGSAPADALVVVAGGDALDSLPPIAARVMVVGLPPAMLARTAQRSRLDGKPVTVVFSGQSPEMNLALVLACQPGARRLGLIAAPDDAFAAALRPIAQRHGLVLEAAAPGSGDAPLASVAALIQRSDALLLASDPGLINRATIGPIARLALAAGKPLFGGHAPVFARLGSAAVVYATPEQMVDEAIDRINAGADAGAYYAVGYTVSLGPTDGCKQRDPAALAARLRRAE